MINRIIEFSMKNRWLIVIVYAALAATNGRCFVATSYGWQAVFVIAVGLNATAALMALFVIKPLRRAFILGNEATTEERARDVKVA